MKILLPDNLNDITLQQYLEFTKLDSDNDGYEYNIFTLFTNVTNVNSVSKKDYDNILKHIYEALQKEGRFSKTFTIDGVDFGLIPNFDKIAVSEYSDLVKYSNTDEDGRNDNLDRLIAVLYRPIKKLDRFGNYNIESYNGTENHIKQVRKLSMSIVNGCLGFFLTLSDDLENHTQRCMVAAQVRELQL